MKTGHSGRTVFWYMTASEDGDLYRAAAELNSSYLVRHGSSTTYELGLEVFVQFEAT